MLKGRVASSQRGARQFATLFDTHTSNGQLTGDSWNLNGDVIDIVRLGSGSTEQHLHHFMDSFLHALSTQPDQSLRLRDAPLALSL